MRVPCTACQRRGCPAPPGPWQHRFSDQSMSISS